MICSLSYDDSSVEPLRSHPVRHAFLGTQMPSGPSTEVYILDPWVWFCYGFGWPGLHVWWCMIWCHLIFPTHHTFDAILGHISAFDWDLQIPTYSHNYPQLWDTHQIGDFVSLHHDSLMDLSLGHFIRLTLSDVSVIFGWSRLRLMDSCIIILSDYMSDLSSILIELLMSHHDRSDTSDAILGHISLIWIWRWSFCLRSVTIPITRPRDVIFASWVTILNIFIEMSFQCSMTFGL